MPIPPKNNSGEPARGSWLAFFLTMLALIGGCALGFLAFPQLFFAIGAIFAVIALQYLLWGWWMERMFRPGGNEEAERNSIDD